MIWTTLLGDSNAVSIVHSSIRLRTLKFAYLYLFQSLEMLRRDGHAVAASLNPHCHTTVLD